MSAGAYTGSRVRKYMDRLTSGICAGVSLDSRPSDYLALAIARWAQTGQLICGHEEGSWAARLTAGLQVARSLPELMSNAFNHVKAGVSRTGAERQVPLIIFRTASWSLWYENLKAVGNRLDGEKSDLKLLMHEALNY